MRTLPLTAKAYVTLDADGNGTASTGPQSSGEQWSGLTAAVRVATNANEAICSTYAGAAATPGYFAGATTWGSTGDSTTNLPGREGGRQRVRGLAGGDPGAQAVLTVTGTKSVA